jgi:lysophospholipase L1-like esterase
VGRTRAARFAVVAALALGSAAAADPRPVRIAATPPHSPPELARFFRDLQRLEAHELDHVHILQLGDSHTAGDALTGRLRSRFQERFGDAGRGLMPPGLAFEGLRQKEVKIAENGRWQIDNSLKLPEGGPYGITGFVARSDTAGAGMSIASTDPDGFDLAELDYLQRPGGGVFDVLLDGRTVGRVSTNGPANRPQRLALNAPPGTGELAVVAKTPGIAFTGWGFERRQRGVLYESQGIVGATVAVIEHWDPAVMRLEIDALKPSLIVLAFGTNEGFSDSLDETAYAAHFAQVLSRLKHLAPLASFLIVAPPDGQRIDPNCPRRNSEPSACRWITPRALASVRFLERNAAIANGAAYWDWSTMMAGPGGIDRWVRLDPPLARPDHVHFTLEGYELAADSLFGRIMDAYAMFKTETAKHPQRRS